MSSIYITTYSDASCTTPSGNPLTIGFNENKLTNTFDVTYDSELPIPPPPPDSNGNPLTTSYITQLYVNVSDGVNNNIPAFTYYIDASSTTVTTLNLAVRNETANGSPVTFKYDKTGLDTIFGTLNITNGSWTLNLVDGSVTGSNGPTVDVQTNDVKVTIPVLGESQFYTMNVEKYVAGILSETITIATAGWNMISVPANAIISAQNVADSLYYFNGSQYQSQTISGNTQLEPYKGYWIKTYESNIVITINYILS